MLELKGSHTLVYVVKLGDEKSPKSWESLPTKNDQFPGELQKLDIPKDKQTIIFEFDSKGE